MRVGFFLLTLLARIAILMLTVWGSALVVTARPVHPVKVMTGPDFNWFQIFTTDVLAVQLMSERDQPVYRSAAFDDPGTAAALKRYIGAGLVALVALIVVLSAVWERLTDRERRPAQAPRTRHGPLAPRS